jgi:putative selenate reductase
VTVCPNRANIALPGGNLVYPLQRAVQSSDGVRVETLGSASAAQLYQVVNLADFCNECGNCASFCPTAGAPYKDKFRMHLSKASFEASGEGAWFSGPGRMDALLDRRCVTVNEDVAGLLVATPEARALLSHGSFQALRVELLPGVEQADLALAAQTAVLYVLASKVLPFSLGEPC